MARSTRLSDMARSTRLVILIKHMYNVWGRKRFFHPVNMARSTRLVILIKNGVENASFYLLHTATNLDSFTLRVTGINILDERRLRKN